jgi:hypothetical protein
MRRRRFHAVPGGEEHGCRHRRAATSPQWNVLHDLGARERHVADGDHQADVRMAIAVELAIRYGTGGNRSQSERCDQRGEYYEGFRMYSLLLESSPRSGLHNVPSHSIDNANNGEGPP